VRRALAAARDLAESLLSRPGRVGLALFALFTGAFSLTVLAGVLRGLDGRAHRIAADFGLHAFVILPSGSSSRPLPAEALERLRAAGPRLVAAGVRSARAETRSGDFTLQVTAVDPELSAIRPFRLRAGRLLDRIDQAGRERVAVVSSTLAARQGWSPGDVLHLGPEPFEIAGVADFPAGHGAGDALFAAANGVLVPYATPAYWGGGDGPAPGPQAIWVRHADDLSTDQAQAWSRRLLDGDGLRPSDFNWVSAADLQAQVRRWQRMLRFTAGGIAALCLLLGGATLMSLLVANVQERVPEIGLRRALGATQGAIARLFLAEALLLTGVAAVAGVLLAAPVARLPWLREADLPYDFDLRVAAWPAAVTLLLGAAFSALPAWRAARIHPADALRGE
jgi:putative ABC transport system permease protein